MFRQALLGAVKTLRLDSWFNELTGVGTALGKTAMAFAPTEGEYLPLPTLEALYNFDGLAAKIVDAVPKHAMRAVPSVVMPGEGAAERVSEALKALGAGACLKSAWTWARLYGGGAVYLGADDGRAPHEPLDLQNLRAVRWIVDVDRRDLYPMTWETDPRKASFGMPRLYRLTRMGGTAAETITVHASRLLRFEGVAPTRRRRLQLQGWGDSILQRVYAELQSSRGAFAAGGALLQEASQGVLKMKGLMEMMAGDEDNILRRRLSLMDLSRSTARSLLLDADGEDYQRVEVGALTGTVDVMDRFINLLAAVSNIPVTVLMGQAPAGLNATGDSDIRSWYDEVAAERTHHLVPQMEELVRLLLHAKEGPTGGVVPASWSVTYPPLWQLTPAEEVDLRAKQASIDVQYVTAQVLTPEEVAINRFRADGWSPETSIDLAARQALLDEDDAVGDAGEDDRVDAGGAEHAAGVAGVVARVAAREIPRTTGVELLVQAFELDAEAADRAMGEAGRTWFTAPEPTHAAEMDAMRADLAKAQASLRGHQAYTARLIQRAKAGGLELGAFTAREPTEVGEGDLLEPGDVVAVPVQDGRAEAGDWDPKEHPTGEGSRFVKKGTGGGGPTSAKPKESSNPPKGQATTGSTTKPVDPLVLHAEAAAESAGHRVATPGNVPERTVGSDLATIPNRYRDKADPAAFDALAADPAHGPAPKTSIVARARREAMAGMEAVSRNLVPGPITREPTGEIEFHDAAGHPWDVKGPPSPRPDRVFPFHAPMIAASIKNELGLTFPNSLTGVHEPRGVILDSTYLTPADHQALWHELRATLTHDEISRIRELTLDLSPDRKV